MVPFIGGLAQVMCVALALALACVTATSQG